MWLPIIFPAGKINGLVFEIGDADGKPGKSLTIPFDGEKAPDLVDFGGDFRGDDLDLYARGTRLSPKDAMRDVTQRFSLAETVVPSVEPSATGSAQFIHPELGAPARVWDYRSPQDDVLMVHARYDKPDGKKEFRPWVRKGEVWQSKWPDPRPLYRLRDFHDAPDCPVLVVEGEKSADAAGAMFWRNYVVTTWPGGCNAVSRADWSPVAGRDVVVWPDADEPGFKAARVVVEACREAGARGAKIVPLPDDLPKGWDLADPLPEGWSEKRVHNLLEGAQGSADDAMGDLVCPADLLHLPPERRWIVPGWLPAKHVAILAGRGGLGKTLLAQQLAAAAAVGGTWLDLPVRKSRTLLVACEDDRDELHRRQISINRAIGMPMADLRDMFWQARAGKQNVLFEVSEGRSGQKTEAFAQLEQTVQSTSIDLLILDNVAQMFAGNENARSDVTQFVNLLHGLAVEYDLTILLLAHPGKTAESEYSGSTAWDAAVRTRWFLDRREEWQEAQGGTNLRVLRRSKSNYAPADAEITLTWDNGAFRSLAPKGKGSGNLVNALAGHNQDVEDERIFLEVLQALTDQRRNVSHKPGCNYAPAVMIDMPMAKGIDKKRLERAMNRLFDAGKISANQLVFKRENYSKALGIVRVDQRQESDQVEEVDLAEAA